MRADAPLELLQLGGPADEDVLADRVDLTGGRDRPAVRGDEALVDGVERCEMLLGAGLAQRIVAPAALGDEAARGGDGGAAQLGDPGARPRAGGCRPGRG